MLQFGSRRVSAFMAKFFSLVCRAQFSKRRVWAFMAKIVACVPSTVWQMPCVGPAFMAKIVARVSSTVWQMLRVCCYG